MFEGYDFWLIILSVLVTSTTLYYSCNFITRIYLSAPSNKAGLLPIYSISIGCMLFCMDNLNWVAMNPIVGSQFSVPMMFGSLFAAIFATFNVFSSASEKRLPLNALINRGFIIGLSSYVMFYLGVASRNPTNAISFDITCLFIALLAATCIGIAVILYFFKMKTYANDRSLVVKISLSFATGSLMIGLYAIFNTTLTVQQQILTTVHTLNNRELIATVFSLSIACLLAITYAAPKHLAQIKTQLSKLNVIGDHQGNDDDLNAKDALTQLPNRHGFEAQLHSAVKRSARVGKTIALAYIDLDHFKPINDNCGHHVGDAVLVAVAKRLNETVRACDFVARLGGDEFVAIIEDIAFDEDITPIISRVVDSMKESFHIDQHHIDISCSIGVAIYPGDGDIQKLIICADAAMYKAKENGKNQFKFFDAEIELASDQMLEMHHDLRQAIDNDEFLLLYQPKIDCKTQKPVGAEALIRWNHPAKGLLLPDDFLPAAERFGLVGNINDWVVEEACRAIDHAKKMSIDLNISINLAHQQFRDPNLVIDVLAILSQYDISPSNLTFEIKETTVISNEALFKGLLTQFKAAKIKVALDDFGSHPFTLTYLQGLNVDEIKLDKVFVANISEDRVSWKLVDILIGLAHALNLNVVAEGVETEVQRKAINELGCNHMQGYLFSRAITEKKLLALFNQMHLHVDTTGQFLFSDFQHSAQTLGTVETLN